MQGLASACKKAGLGSYLASVQREVKGSVHPDYTLYDCGLKGALDRVNVDEIILKDVGEMGWKAGD